MTARPLNQNPNRLRAIAVAWGGVLYYYKADRHGFLLLVASLLAVAAGCVRGLSGGRLALLIAALTPGQSAIMLGYAMRAILRLCGERGLRVDLPRALRALALAETVVLAAGTLVAAAVLLGS